LHGLAALLSLPGGKLPLMDIPRVVRACVQPPPPPQLLPPASCTAQQAGPVGGSAAEGARDAGSEQQQRQRQQPARPQTRLRYLRVAQQSVAALALLEQGLSAAASSAEGKAAA
jgi:hypothetical protein